MNPGAHREGDYLESTPGDRPAARASVKRPSHVALNTGVQYAGRAVGAVVGLAQVAILSHYLRSRGFGEYGYVLSVIGIGTIFADLGVTAVTVRSLSEGGSDARARTLGAAIVARGLLAVVAVVASDAFAFVFPVDTMIRGGILLMSSMYLLTVPGSIASIFQAELELQYPFVVTSLQVLCGLAVTVALVGLHATLLPLLGGQLGAAALAAIANYLIAVRRYHLVIRPRLRGGLGIVAEALPVGIGQALVVLYFRIDGVLLGLLRGPVDVAHYTAAYRFVDLANFGASAFMGAAFPFMVRVHRGTDRGQLLRIYQNLVDIMMIAVVPLCVLWFILARPIILLVFPTDFGPAAVALRILTLALVPLFLNNVLGALVLTLHREKTFNWIAVGALVVNVALNLIFIPGHGIAAAAVMTVVSELLVTVCAVVVMWRVIRFVPSINRIALAAVAGVVMIVPVYGLRGYWPAAVGVGALVYIAAARVLRLWSWDTVRQVSRELHRAAE